MAQFEIKFLNEMSSQQLNDAFQYANNNNNEEIDLRYGDFGDVIMPNMVHTVHEHEEYLSKMQFIISYLEDHYWKKYHYIPSSSFLTELARNELNASINIMLVEDLTVVSNIINNNQ